MRSHALHFASFARRLLATGAGSRVISGFMTVAMLTVVAKSISFVKDATIAHHFGTANSLDAFMLAFTLVAFGATVVGGGLPEAFLPTYSALKHERNAVRANRFGIQACFFQFAFLLGIAALVWCVAPLIIQFTTRGFSPENQVLATDLLRRLSPSLICFGMAHQLAIWLRADKRFAVSSAAPMLVPVGIIGTLLLAGTDAHVGHLVSGTLFGSAAYLLALSLALRHHMHRDQALPRRVFRLLEPSLQGTIRRAGPFMMAGIVFSSAVVVDQAMAAWLESGSVAVLSYTEKICSIILALTAGPACDVLFPYFSDAAAKKDWYGLRRQLLQSSGLIVGAALPAMLGLLLFAPWVVHVLFERGEFGPGDTARVAHVLRFAALQIPFYILGGLLSRVIVSLQASRFILGMSITALALNIAFNAIFMTFMGAAGIALSTVLVHLLVSLVAGWHVLRLIRQQIRLSEKGTPAS